MVTFVEDGENITLRVHQSYIKLIQLSNYTKGINYATLRSKGFDLAFSHAFPLSGFLWNETDEN